MREARPIRPRDGPRGPGRSAKAVIVAGRRLPARSRNLAPTAPVKGRCPPANRPSALRDRVSGGESGDAIGSGMPFGVVRLKEARRAACERNGAGLSGGAGGYWGFGRAMARGQAAAKGEEVHRADERPDGYE